MLLCYCMVFFVFFKRHSFRALRETQVHESMNMNLTNRLVRVSSYTHLFIEKKNRKIRCKRRHDEDRKLWFRDRAARTYTANTHQGRPLQEEPCSGPTSFLLTNILHHCLSHQVNKRRNYYQMLSDAGSCCDFGCVLQIWSTSFSPERLISNNLTRITRKKKKKNHMQSSRCSHLMPFSSSKFGC